MAFPNAEIMVPAKDWEFWMSEENASKAQSNEMMKNYFANVKKIYAGIENKVTKYDWGKEVAPGITSIAAPGHTPGHTAFAVASGNSKVLIQSDVTNIPEFFLRNPDWHVAYDIDPKTGTGDPAQILRHGVGREGDGGGLPLHLPLDRSCREGRHEIPAGPCGVESGDLTRGARLTKGRLTGRLFLQTHFRERWVSASASFMHLHVSAIALGQGEPPPTKEIPWPIHIVTIAGSLRKESFTLKIANALAKLAPASLKLE